MTTMIVASVATGALATIARWLLTRRSVILREVGRKRHRRLRRAPRNWACPGPGRPSCISGPQGVRPATGYAEGRRRLRRSGRCCSHRGRPGLQPAGSAAIFGGFAAHHVDLRCRRATALPDLRGPQGRRPALCPETTVGLSTMRLGKLSDVSARIEPMLTKRRAVDLCRLAGCCCCCSC